MNRHRLILIFIILLSSQAFGNEDILVHQHYTKWVGILPEPYNTLELEIQLDPSNDNVQELLVRINGEAIKFDHSDIEKLEDLELGTMTITHNIYSTSDDYEDIPEESKDVILIRFEAGKRHRISYDDNSKTKWGRDRVIITIARGKHVKIIREKFSWYHEDRWI